MSIETIKKYREEAVLTQFRALYQSFPNGKVIAAERPDFIIEQTSSRLGIELTQIHEKDEPAPPCENLIDKILLDAQGIYTQADELDCYVSVIFNEPCMASLKPQDMAKALVDLVIKHQPMPGQFEILDFPSLGLIHNFPYVNRLLIHTYSRPTSVGSIFYSPRSLWFKKIGRTHVERSLHAKEAKYPFYKTAASPVWLLMELNGYFSATDLFSVEHVLNDVFKSSFEKAFVINCFDNRLHELKIIK